MRLFNAYRNRNVEKPLEDMNDDYVEEDNTNILLTDYSNWLATTDITKYFDEDLKSNSTIKINSTTLKNYLSNFIIMLKDKFSKNCVWEEPKCTMRMIREDFEKNCKREQYRGNVDISEDTKRGIYSKTSPRINAIDDHWMSNIYI